MNYNTFNTKYDNHILTVSFNNLPINLIDEKMLNDLMALTEVLNTDIQTKVVIFESLNEQFFLAHYDIDILKDLSTTPVLLESVTLSKLQIVLQKISSLKQCTIAKISGFARGGGHEFCLACDMRFAVRSKAVFMQMEVGMGILPCGGGSSRLARQIGLGKALEMILSARDYSADEAYELGTINKVLNSYEIDHYVNTLAQRIASFPIGSIEACKKTIYSSIDLPIFDALRYEEYQLYQATSQTPAVARFQYASATNFQYSIKNQINFESELMKIQDIK